MTWSEICVPIYQCTYRYCHHRWGWWQERAPRRSIDPSTGLWICLEAHLLKIVAKTFPSFVDPHLRILSTLEGLIIECCPTWNCFQDDRYILQFRIFSLQCRKANKQNSIQNSITFQKNCCTSGTFTASHLENTRWVHLTYWARHSGLSRGCGRRQCSTVQPSDHHQSPTWQTVSILMEEIDIK